MLLQIKKSMKINLLPWVIVLLSVWTVGMQRAAGSREEENTLARNSTACESFCPTAGH